MQLSCIKQQQQKHTRLTASHLVNPGEPEPDLHKFSDIN